MKVIVEKVHKVKISALLPGQADFYSRPLTANEAAALVAMFPGTAERYEAWRFTLRNDHDILVMVSVDYASVGACSAWASYLAKNIGADLEGIPS